MQLAFTPVPKESSEYCCSSTHVSWGHANACCCMDIRYVRPSAARRLIFLSGTKQANNDCVTGSFFAGVENTMPVSVMRYGLLRVHGRGSFAFSCLLHLRYFGHLPTRYSSITSRMYAVWKKLKYHEGTPSSNHVPRTVTRRTYRLQTCG